MTHNTTNYALYGQIWMQSSFNTLYFIYFVLLRIRNRWNNGSKISKYQKSIIYFFSFRQNDTKNWECKISETPHQYIFFRCDVVRFFATEHENAGSCTVAHHQTHKHTGSSSYNRLAQQGTFPMFSSLGLRLRWVHTYKVRLR